MTRAYDAVGLYGVGLGGPIRVRPLRIGPCGGGCLRVDPEGALGVVVRLPPIHSAVTVAEVMTTRLALQWRDHFTGSITFR